MIASRVGVSVAIGRSTTPGSSSDRIAWTVLTITVSCAPGEAPGSMGAEHDTSTNSKMENVKTRIRILEIRSFKWPEGFMSAIILDVTKTIPESGAPSMPAFAKG